VIVTNTYYPELNIDGVNIQSRKFLKGNLTSGVMEVIEFVGRKEGRWAQGHLYNADKYTYEEALEHWKENRLPKFSEVTNGKEIN
jgi:hypothetical protein